MTKPDVLIRKMQEDDLDAVIQIQALAYSDDFLESPQVFARKLQLAPDFCWVAQQVDQVLGYLFSHPWINHLPPALHTPLELLPSSADTWFVHDMAILPGARGMGLASRLYQMAQKTAHDYQLQDSLLVAMPGVDAFWSNHGYQKITELSHQQQLKLAQYGPGSQLMCRKMINHPAY